MTMTEKTLLEIDDRHIDVDATTTLKDVDGAVLPTSRLFMAFWVLMNTLATVSIVFINKVIFSTEYLSNCQTSFAAFHMLCTTLTLYMLSQPCLKAFTPKAAALLEILPLAVAMCGNIIFPNLSLRYSSIAFYQIARVLLSPACAMLNYILYRLTLPLRPALALIPVCAGVGIFSYLDAISSHTTATGLRGFIFTFAGVLSSSLYTVWIGSFHKKLQMNSMQLLFNQAPLGAFLLIFVIPFVDDLPSFSDVPQQQWLLVAASGACASLINLSQFKIVAGAGAVTSTVVGHAKTVLIVTLGWLSAGRGFFEQSVLFLALAVAGIVLYTVEMEKAKRKSTVVPTALPK